MRCTVDMSSNARIFFGNFHAKSPQQHIKHIVYCTVETLYSGIGI